MIYPHNLVQQDNKIILHEVDLWNKVEKTSMYLSSFFVILEENINQLINYDFTINYEFYNK